MLRSKNTDSDQKKQFERIREGEREISWLRLSQKKKETGWENKLYLAKVGLTAPFGKSANRNVIKQRRVKDKAANSSEKRRNYELVHLLDRLLDSRSCDCLNDRGRRLNANSEYRNGKERSKGRVWKRERSDDREKSKTTARPETRNYILMIGSSKLKHSVHRWTNGRRTER